MGRLMSRRARRRLQAEHYERPFRCSAPALAVTDEAVVSVGMDAGAVDKRDCLRRPDRPSASGTYLARHPLTVLLVPAPFQFVPGEKLGLSARSSTAELTMPRSLFVLIAPPFRVRPIGIGGRSDFLIPLAASGN